MARRKPDLGRFSDPSLLILASLAAGPKHGYAMILDIEAFSGTRLEPGTLYGAIVRLERRRWIAALPAEDRRRPYALTPAGAAALREQVPTLQRVTAAAAARLGAAAP
jgi:DNA-binding PadR family transcriptional regulator